MYDDQQEMIPLSKRGNFGNRCDRGVKYPHQGPHFDNPFRSPFSPPTCPSGTPRFSSPLVFRERPQWRQQYPSTPPTPTSFCPRNPRTSYSPHWSSSPGAYSPYSYKSTQYMARGRSNSGTPNGRRSNSYRSSAANSSPEQFNVSDYVIPAMTSNPWAKLEENYYANRRAEK